MAQLEDPEAVRQAKVQGHRDLEWDPPHGLSRVLRWTCRTCGNAVLDSGTVIYGSAITEPCRG